LPGIIFLIIFKQFMSANPNPKKKLPAKKRKAVQKPVVEVIDTYIPTPPSPHTLPQPAEPMEVHHHPDVEKKGLKEYILEGLMIFLAVTMGFFAESLREHINNHDKEVQYMKTFAQDLQTDSANMCATLAHLDTASNGIHMLITLLHSPAATAANGAKVYYYARVSTTNLTFHTDDRTLTQLKNSGGYSLITNKAVIDSITTYESQIDRYAITNAVAIQEAQLTYPYMAKLFDAFVFETMVTDKYTIVMPAGNPQLILKDPAAINEMIYFLHQRESTLIASIVFLKKVQMREKNVYAFLHKEYKLDD
jgi:hypothetical protein